VTAVAGEELREIMTVPGPKPKEGERMKAVVHDRYGPPEVLRLEEVEVPVPNDGQVLIRVHATTVNRSDCGWRSAKPFFARLIYPLFFGAGSVLRPQKKILGGELAGEIEAAGAAVTEFAVGDRVFGTSLFGANAELVCMRAKGPLTHMPAGLSFEEAAAVPDGFILALGILRKANLREGQKVLIYGASGSMGTAAVQLAKHFGAHVTAVCNSKNLELVKSLGADEAVDYTKEDFTKSGKSYDAIFDAVGKHSFMRCRRSLKPGGIFLASDGLLNMLLILWTRWFGDKRVMSEVPPHYKKEDVVFLKELIEEGRYRPVIDRTYPLEDVVEATRYVETGQKTGNVVLTVGAGAA
jgi:NADPH:quinone reductase-like Zn-dependent oxidoreductase